MKKLFLFIFIFCIILSGCSNSDKEKINDFLNAPIYNNKSGSYFLFNSENKEIDESLSFKLNMDSLTFTCVSNKSTDLIKEGNIYREGGRLILTTSDGKEKLVFRIADIYTIQFLKEVSVIKSIDKDNNFDIEDKAIFTIKQEERVREQVEVDSEEDNFIYWAY